MSSTPRTGRRSRIAVAVLPLLAGGCALSRGSAGGPSLVKEDRAPVAATCESGILTPVTISRQDPPFPQGIVSFDGLAPEDAARLVAPSASNFVRLDYCVDDDDDTRSRLVSISLKQTVIGAVETITADELTAAGGKAEVHGLTQALFGDNSGLHVLFERPHDLPGDQFDFTEVWRFDGWPAGGPKFATFASLVRRPDGMQAPVPILAGTVAVGDPEIAGDCPTGERFGVAEFDLATAHFTFKMCTRTGAGRTRIYTIKGLGVTDANPLLAADQRTFARDDLVLDPPIGEGEPAHADLGDGKSFTYRVNHHNSCDSFVLDLGHAKYAASSAEAVGHCTVLDGAPAQDATLEKALRFNIRYAGQPAGGDVAHATCHHWIFPCDPG
jgi:hypothetical protein